MSLFGAQHPGNRHGVLTTPPITANLQAWMDFTDLSQVTLVSGKVSQITDKSGNANTFAQGTAGNRMVYTQSLFQGLGGATGLSSALHTVFSNNPITALKGNNLTAYVIGRRNSNVLGEMVTDYQNSIYTHPTYNGRLSGTGGEGVGTLKGVPINQPVIIGMVNTGTLATTKLFTQDGVLSTLYNGNPHGDGSDGGYWFIGAGQGSGADMDYAGVLLYSTAHDSSQVAQMLAWLKQYYMIPTLQPTAVAFAFAGDSITAGYYGHTNAFPSIAMASCGYSEHDFILPAAGGWKIADLQSHSADVTGYYNGGIAANKNVVCVHIGTNDLATIGANVSSIETAYNTLCTTYRNAGFKVVCSTIVSRHLYVGTTSPTIEADRITFNSWLRSNYTGFADALADCGNDANMGQANDCDDTTYFNADGTHPNSTGHSVMAGYFATAIQSL